MYICITIYYNNITRLDRYQLREFFVQLLRIVFMRCTLCHHTLFNDV